MKKKFLRHFPLSLTKDFVLIYRASVIGIFIVGCLFIKFSIDQEKEKIEDRVIVASEQVEKSISYNVDYLKYQLFYATKQIKENKADIETKKVAKILSSFVSNINSQIDISITWNAFSWIDRHNKMSADGAGGVIPNPVDVSNRDYLKITSTIPERLVFGKPIIGALSGRPIIPVGMGVFSDQGVYSGTLVFGLDIDRIVDKITKTIGNETFSFAVLQGQTLSFASRNLNAENRSIVDNFFNDSKNLKKFPNDGIVSSQGLFSKDKSFICLRNIDESPLKVLVFYNKHKSYQQIFNLFLRQSFYIFLVIFCCLILFQKIYYRIVKPVSKLSQFALKISKKDFDFSIERPQGKELIDLFNTLNSVKEVAKREEELLRKLEITNNELFRANEAKAEFLAKSSHDIKNYIYGICGLSRIILDNKSKSEILQSEELQMVETIADQSEELMHFVEDLLDTNQIEAGEFSLEKFKPYDVTTLIDRIVLLNKSLAIRHHIVIKTAIESDLKLYCDVRRMKQILVNIITNAIKYSKPKTNVTISAKYLKTEDKICIEVLDEGFGMTQEEVEILLQGHGKNIDKTGISDLDSHGIGMSIVLKLVKMHNGKIEIESKKNEGTKIKLFFDSYSSEENDESKKSKNQKNTEKNKAILLVEDNPANIKITSKILRDIGYKTHHVENGEDALKILDEEDFDLILMDGEMPIMNGYEAATKIREGKVFKKFKNYKKIPIIALMSSSDEKTIKRALDSGMNSHLEKSTSKTKLSNMLEDWLG